MKPLALMFLLATGCGEDPVEEPTDDVEADEEDAQDEDEGDEGSTGKIDAGGGKIDAGKPAGDKKDAGSAADANTPAKDASTPAPTKDAAAEDAGKDAATADSGKPDAGKADAGKPVTDGNGACNDKTPHGCYTPASGNGSACPAQSPEIPTGYPSIDQWDGCNGAFVAGISCTWNGPNGATANCLCDAGAHWLCFYL